MVPGERGLLLGASTERLEEWVLPWGGELGMKVSQLIFFFVFFIKWLSRPQ
jgi:hypothetical protein